MFSKETTTENSIKPSLEKKAYSEIIMESLVNAKKLLKSAPQTIEIRGGIIKLDAAIGSIAQAGKFAEVKSKE
jgi:hypothetical protein